MPSLPIPLSIPMVASWHGGPLPSAHYLCSHQSVQSLASIFTLLLLRTLNIHGDNHMGCLPEWSILCPSRASDWFGCNDSILRGVPQPHLPLQPSHFDTLLLQNMRFAEMCRVDPDYLWFCVCEFAYLLTFICKPLISACGTFPSIHKHVRLQSGEKLEAPEMHVSSQGGRS